MVSHLEQDLDMTLPQTPRNHLMSYPHDDRSPRIGVLRGLAWQPGHTLRADDFSDSSTQLCRALYRASRVLCRASMADIQQILDADPDAAWMPVFMPDMQPPVGAAIRLRCDLTLIDLLLARGGNVTMVNSHGQNPLSELASCLPGIINDGRQSNNKEEAWILNVAVKLLQAGCSTTDEDSSGRTPIQAALDNGRPKLACLIQEWQNFKTCLMLTHVNKKASLQGLGDFQKIPSHLTCRLLEFTAVSSPMDIINQLQ